MKGAAILDRLQPLGSALMLPIAVLPIAALPLRLGQPDMLDIAFVAAEGEAIFSNLGLLFAAGVAVAWRARTTVPWGSRGSSASWSLPRARRRCSSSPPTR